MKTRIKSSNDEATDFHDKKMPEVGSKYYLLGGNINFVLKTDRRYYPQLFLKEYNYIEKEKRWSDVLLIT